MRNVHLTGILALGEIHLLVILSGEWLQWQEDRLTCRIRLMEHRSDMLTLISSIPAQGIGCVIFREIFAVNKVYFFRSNKVRMTSPTIKEGMADHLCFSFWFAAFGAGDTTSLRIYRQDVKGGEDNNDNDDNSPTIWNMSATTLNTARPDWFSGQVTVNAQSDFRLILEGKATNGGFAVDQLIFYPGKCESKFQNRTQNFGAKIHIFCDFSSSVQCGPN